MTSATGSLSTTAKFHFNKIGPIDEAELELGDLTVIAGRNNTGKTYLVYTLYGFLRTWSRWWPDIEGLLTGKKSVAHNHSTFQSPTLDRIAAKILREGHARQPIERENLNRERTNVLQSSARAFSESTLADVFSSPRSSFAGASFEVELSNEFPRDKEALKVIDEVGDFILTEYDGQNLVITSSGMEEQRPGEYPLATVLSYPACFQRFLFPELSLEPFILSAERFGISLFYRELDFTKNRLVEILRQMGDDEDRERFSPYFVVDRTTSRYALPIKDNIDFTRDIADRRKDRSELLDHKLFDDIKDMVDGYYRSDGDDIQFRSKARKERSFAIPLHIASSSARGLSDLYFFLRHVARKDHLLIIDEPESHLDTANQIQLARLLARCVRAGLKVLMTTHSDYLIKEFNNLIMLSRPFADKEAVVKNLRYREDDFLAPESVRAYVAEENTLRKCEVDDYGIDMPVFDETIDSINNVANELASRLAEDVET